uniref:Uncharacterized protein n=1 Tax=Physcomitrium patens TaxID=3218 RepID=A0A2K1I9M5_PHYPA|nr:hypothetical protein PHYPA_031252 [Physcomitrium patens]
MRCKCPKCISLLSCVAFSRSRFYDFRVLIKFHQDRFHFDAAYKTHNHHPSLFPHTLYLLSTCGFPDRANVINHRGFGLGCLPHLRPHCLTNPSPFPSQSQLYPQQLTNLLMVASSCTGTSLTFQPSAYPLTFLPPAHISLTPPPTAPTTTTTTHTEDLASQAQTSHSKSPSPTTSPPSPTLPEAQMRAGITTQHPDVPHSRRRPRHDAFLPH